MRVKFLNIILISTIILFLFSCEKNIDEKCQIIIFPAFQDIARDDISYSSVNSIIENSIYEWSSSIFNPEKTEFRFDEEFRDATLTREELIYTQKEYLMQEFEQLREADLYKIYIISSFRAITTKMNISFTIFVIPPKLLESSEGRIILDDRFDKFRDPFTLEVELNASLFLDSVNPKRKTKNTLRARRAIVRQLRRNLNKQF